MKILIAEDDTHIRQGLADLLSHEGYHVIGAENGAIALNHYHQEKPDFVILDIMMPEMDGYSVCRAIRKVDEEIPIIFISAKGEEIDKVVGLELGADDYIHKPFGIHEVRARIKAIAKRCLRKHSHIDANNTFQLDDLHITPRELCAKREGQVIELSLRDIKILECLFINKNKVVTRDMLFNYAWGYDHLPNSRTLDQHVSKLRKAIEKDVAHPVIIRTVHGAGYRYCDPLRP